MAVFRERKRQRKFAIQKFDDEIRNSEGALHLQYNGKIVNRKERLVVVLTSPAGKRLMRVKTFEKEESVTGQRIFDILVETFSE